MLTSLRQQPLCQQSPCRQVFLRDQALFPAVFVSPILALAIFVSSRAKAAAAEGPRIQRRGQKRHWQERNGEPSFFVYVVASLSRTLYIGLTNDLIRRVHEHKRKELPGFTGTYNVYRLVYFEEFGTPAAAISREKQLKSWRREKKIRLIESVNPSWNDLSTRWCG